MNIFLALFLTILISFLFYLLVQFTAPTINQYVSEQLITSSDLLNIADNGDLIFFSGDTAGERFIRWGTNSYVSHVGLLFKEGDDVYILDCDLGQKSRDGVRVMKLKDKLERYKGLKLGVLKKYLGVRPEYNKFITLMEKYLSFDFDDLMLTWGLTWSSTLYNLTKREKMVFCSEFTVMCLLELEILNTKKLPSWYSPKDLLVFSKYEKYGENIFFEF